MKLTVFGASGGTGTQVIRQALDGGHQVTAVVRDRSRLAVADHPWLDVVEADVLRPGAIEGTVAGRDAVVSALGPSRRPAERKAAAHSRICTDSARSITTAMRAAGTGRLVVVSASGPFTEGDGPVMRYLAKPLAQRVLRDPFADLVAMEAVVRGSGLDWTILRPPRLTGKPLTGRYRTRRELNVPRGSYLPRADLAHLILAVCGDPGTSHTAIFAAR